MLEKPDIPDELITSSIQSEYRLDVAQVTFLPLGLDVNTAVYRIEDRMGIAYFLILRKGDFNPITGAIPNFLSSLGVHTVIAPIQTHNGQLGSDLNRLFKKHQGDQPTKVGLVNFRGATLVEILCLFRSATLVAEGGRGNWPGSS